MQSGTKNERPAGTQLGQWYFNTDSNTVNSYNGSSWDDATGGAFAKAGAYSAVPSYHPTGTIYCVNEDDHRGTVFWTGSFWSSTSVKGANFTSDSGPTFNGKFQCEAQFDVARGLLFLWTGSQWYKFTGSLVT